MISKKILSVLVYAVMAVSLLFVAGCDSYDNPKDDAKNAYYVDDSYLLSAETLKEWIDNDNRSNRGYRVVVLDVDGRATRDYIPGSLTVSKSFFEMSRNDGPGSVGTQVMDGPSMDAALRQLGVDKNTVVVLTGEWAGATPGVNNVTTVWWYFHYWGFSKANVKILNGGNLAYAALAGVTMADTPADMATVKPSTFSVKELPGNRIDLARAAFGEIFDNAKSGAYADRKEILVNTLSGSIPFVKPDNTIVRVPNTGSVFGGRIAGSILLDPMSLFTDDANYAGVKIFQTDPTLLSFKDNDTGLDFLPADKNVRLVTHCGAGVSTTPYNFILQEVMGYTNVGMYDGSMSEWTMFSVYQPTDNTSTYVRFGALPAFPSTPPNNLSAYLTWDETTGTYNVSNGTFDEKLSPFNGSNLNWNSRWDTTRFTEYLFFIRSATGAVTSSVLTPNYNGDAREVNKEDKLYQENKSSNTGNGAGNVGSGNVAGC